MWVISSFVKGFHFGITLDISFIPWTPRNTGNIVPEVEYEAGGFGALPCGIVSGCTSPIVLLDDDPDRL